MFVRIVGAGAVGIVVADKLSAVADTAFIINEERRERYKSGVMLNGRKLSIPCITSDDASPADLLIFAVKNFSLEEAIEEARPFVGPDTIIMPLLNGIEQPDPNIDFRRVDTLQVFFERHAQSLTTRPGDPQERHRQT